MRFGTRLRRWLRWGTQVSRPRPARRSVRPELCLLERRDVPTAGALVPAYFYPSPGGSQWDQLAADAGRIPIMAILNPASGPGSAQDPNYVAAVDNLRAAGGQVIGYVHTSYAGRDFDRDIRPEIDDYISWYHVDGFFIDETTTDPSEPHLAYYQQIYDYVHGINPDWTVVGNPGTNTDEAYLTRPTADIMVLFENGTGYDTYTPPDWQANYPAAQFAHLVYNVPSADTMQTYVSLAASRNTGWLYVTDGNLPNPWGALPAYWEDFVAALAAGGGPVGPPAAPNAALPAGTEEKNALFHLGPVGAELHWTWAAGATPVFGLGALSSPIQQQWETALGHPAVLAAAHEAGSLALSDVQDGNALPADGRP
jgi:hypothetical protein